MAREDRDPYETRATRAPHRGDTEPTDRLGGSERDPAADPLNADWRGSRVTRRNRRSQGIPSSRQEFALWLQYGGWRIVAAAAALVVLLVLMIYVSRSPRQVPSATPTEVAASAGSGVGGSGLSALPSATASISPTLAPAVNTNTGGAQFRVINTGAEGLFLRPDHSTDGPPVKTLPEGAVVTIIGQDYIAPDRVWKNIRDAEGSEGWVASDYLQAVQ